MQAIIIRSCIRISFVLVGVISSASFTAVMVGIASVTPFYLSCKTWSIVSTLWVVVTFLTSMPVFVINYWVVFTPFRFCWILQWFRFLLMLVVVVSSATISAATMTVVVSTVSYGTLSSFCMVIYVIFMPVVCVIIGAFHINFPGFACWDIWFLANFEIIFALAQHSQDKNSNQYCCSKPIFL